ncbi:MAG: hypothetical protein ACLQF0_02260 [Dissulfurispiraceae bacterium]
MEAKAIDQEDAHYKIAKAKEALHVAKERMQALRFALRDITPEERQGRFLRIVELVDILRQGIDAVESALHEPEAK